MSKVKPVTPYQRLLEAAREYANAIKYPHTVFMWRYPKERLKGNWSLDDLNERVAAASQLGYDVKLVSTNEGLEVHYVKKAPTIPWEFKL